MIYDLLIVYFLSASENIICLQKIGTDQFINKILFLPYEQLCGY